jgi:hypothetical protein
MRSMTRRALAMIALGAAVSLFFACLPELSALKTAPADAGDETTPIAPIEPCGDGFIDEDGGEECDPGDASVACVGCKVACPGITDDASAHCYYFTDGGATSYQAAAGSCAGGHLVTIGSDREAAFVDGLDAGAYWVGASLQEALAGFGAVVETEPGIAADGGCPGCFARPIVQGDGGCLVALDGGWSLSPCFDGGATTTICEREPLGTRSFFCPGPYCATVKGAAKRYVIYASAAVTAEAAAAECARYDQGRLVVFESREERERVVREILLLGVETDPTPFTAWIGVSNDGGTWSWDDGRPIDDGGRPSPWGADQPGANTGRAFIRVGKAFYDSQLAQANGDVTATRPFICQRAP